MKAFTLFPCISAYFLEFASLGTLISGFFAGLQNHGLQAFQQAAEIDAIEVFTLIAQEGGGGEGAGGTNPMAFFLPYVLIGLLAYFLFVVPSRNKQQKFQQMLDGLKENDHVVTTGGIHGVVTNVNRDQLKVTLRVDESSGSKLKVSFWAIDSIESDSKEPTSTNKS